MCDDDFQRRSVDHRDSAFIISDPQIAAIVLQSHARWFHSRVDRGDRFPRCNVDHFDLID